jgi:hypothetical protein
MKYSESKIQQECVIWFTNTFCLKHHSPRLLMFSVPNEGKDAKEQSRKLQTGMLSGVSDTIIDFGKKLVYCEFKDDKGKQSDKQVKFQERVESLGREYWVIRSLEDFKTKVYENKI